MMAGPLRVVHTPRQQRLMRGDEEPFLRRPLIEKVEPYAPLPVVPWYDPGMGRLDLEYGASMDPRSNPAFADSWVIGATGGANRVIPQGVDYSRTPCCAPNGMSGNGSPGVGVLFAGLVGVPLVLLGMLLVGEAAAGGQRPFDRRRRNAGFVRPGLLGLWDIYGPLHRDVYTQLVKLGRNGGDHIKVWEGVTTKHPHVDPWEVQVALEDLQREGAVSQVGNNWQAFTALAAQGMR